MESGERSLERLLRSMRPELDPATYVFVTLALGAAIPAALDPIGTFREDEGLTLIVERGAAGRAGLAVSFPCRRLTLTVHSSLEAVGLTAAVAHALAAEGISANVVAAFFHDHVFVPEPDGERALAILARLAETADIG